MHKIIRFTILGIFLIIISAHTSSFANQQLTLGAGKLNSESYQVGQSICQLINKNLKNVECILEDSNGSLYNINRLKSNDFDLIISKSSDLYESFKAINNYDLTQPSKDTRTLLWLNFNSLTLLIRAEEDIFLFDDIIGKRVSIAKGEAEKYTKKLFANKKWSARNFKILQTIPASEQINALCNNEIDAAFYLVTHPSKLIKAVTSTCNTRLIAIDGEDIRKFVNGNYHFSYNIITPNLYAGNPENIVTIGNYNILSANKSFDPKIAYDITKLFYENFEQLKTDNPIFTQFNLKQNKTQPHAPLHKGVEKYYREIGIF